MEIKTQIEIIKSQDKIAFMVLPPMSFFLLYAKGDTQEEAKSKIMDMITSRIMDLDKIHSDLAHNNYEVQQ